MKTHSSDAFWRKMILCKKHYIIVLTEVYVADIYLHGYFLIFYSCLTIYIQDS